jgi:surface antigen
MFLGHTTPSYATVEQIPIPLAPKAPVEYPMLPAAPEIIPADSTPKVEAPEIVAIATELETFGSIRPAVSNSGGNSYVWGQCTWHVKNKRPDLPNNLGNGGSWVANAASYGFSTGTTPRAGAVGEQPGHVVYVESVNADGTVNISEMNYAGGVGVVHTRTVAASTFTYIY